jgi:hypothetical protein
MHGTLIKTKQRMRNSSRITSGRSLLPHGTDMNSVWSRRWSDLIRLFVEELGGDNIVSQAERSLVRRIATIQVACEKLEQEFADDDDTPIAKLDQYQRLSNTLRRLLTTVGIKRVPREVPDLQDYIANRATTVPSRPVKKQRVMIEPQETDDDD